MVWPEPLTTSNIPNRTEPQRDKIGGNIMKIICGLGATLCAVLAQVAFIGLNGLTLVSVPLTIYLGVEILERLTEPQANE